MHIKLFKLSALRGINYSISPFADMWGADAGYEEMPEAELKRINIFCGRNGAGKSTVLDVVRSLRKPDLLISLRREIADRKALRAFDLTFDNQHAVKVQFKSKGIDIQIFSRSDYQEEIIDHALPWVEAQSMSREQQCEVRRAIATLRPMVFHWRGPDQGAIGDRFAGALWQLGSELVGLTQDSGHPAITYMDGDRVGLDYAADPDKWHTIAAQLLPSGWRAAAGLIAWVSRLPKGSIATIEEPETHLHPRLQRKVARELARVATVNDLQLLVSTHSPVFMNASSWNVNAQASKEIQLFQVDGRRFTEIPLHGNSHEYRTAATLLEDIGVLASDLLQANAVVWVEGPSDRIYIKYWLQRWCEFHREAHFVENVDYVFCMYGGAILSHFDAESERDAADAISMLSVNRNSFVVLDRDDDFRYAEGGELVRTKHGVRPKYQVLDALPDQCWVTDGYTMETYLPSIYLEKGFLDEIDGRTMIGNKRTKVELARRYVRDTTGLPYEEIFRANFAEPSGSLASLHKFIASANQ